ncbi:ATP-binding protein [Mycobacterium asiaticum]|uniref:ATP-binding protein n=1 Tax=Mycobacterium asiaticum TaxID=1790 RepID=UPI0009BEA6FB|nr:ATP-binding protein [Mycobacterium asiaticum]
MSGSTSSDPVGIGDADEFGDSHTGTADPHTVAMIRRKFGHWLDQHLELDEERAADIVLATDEAMSNCADHAYRVLNHVGDLTLKITYYPVSTELRVCVIDHGHWVEPDTSPSNARGRGILLMRTLADDCTIDGGAEGTTVCLRFFGCPPNNFVFSQAS